MAEAHAALRPSATTTLAAACLVLASIKIVFPKPSAPTHRVQNKQHRQDDEGYECEGIHLTSSPLPIRTINNPPISQKNAR
jgi:hypothetical protein